MNHFNEYLNFQSNFIELEKVKRVLSFIIFNEINRVGGQDYFTRYHMEDEDYENDDYYKCSNILEVKLETLKLEINSYVSNYSDKSKGYFYYLRINGRSVYLLAYRIITDWLIPQKQNEEIFGDNAEDRIDLSPNESMLVNVLIREYMTYCNKNGNNIDLNDIFAGYIGDDEDDINEEENNKEK